MRPPGTTPLRDGGADRGGYTHHHSHRGLLRDESTVSLGGFGHGRPDAIIVPATRTAFAQGGVVELAADLGSTVVVLCSGQATVTKAADRIGRTLGARGIAVQVDQTYTVPDLKLETSSDALTPMGAGRRSNLSAKRNLGLLLARYHGWKKIVFIDDDITLLGPQLARLSFQLDDYRIAGMACRNYPDNSVFCHARRLAKLPQDVFVTGAVLGVNCTDLPLPFFPDIYNEDWFFFAEAAARHRLANVGEARQAEYDPYACAARARHEEFGDLLAEGLYALLDCSDLRTDPTKPGDFVAALAALATEKYWSTVIEVRRDDLQKTRSRLTEFMQSDNCSDQVEAAVDSLKAAEERYDGDEAITPWHCATFLDAWRTDLDRWNGVYQKSNRVGGTAAALEKLGITTSACVR